MSDWLWFGGWRENPQDMNVLDNIERYEAVVQRLWFEKRIPRSNFYSNSKLSLITDHVLDDLAFVVEQRLCCTERVTETKTIEYPCDWMEHFKQRWFPKWAIRKWPVKMVVVNVNTKITRMCPHITVPDNQNHFRWLAFDDYEVPMSKPSTNTEPNPDWRTP